MRVTGTDLLIVKGRVVSLSDSEVERYSRQLVLPRVERSRSGTTAGCERHRRRRRSARLAGSHLSRRRGRRTPWDRRRRFGRALEPSSPAASLHTRYRPDEGGQCDRQVERPQPRGPGRPLSGGARRVERRGDRERRGRRGRLLRLLRDTLPRERHLRRGSESHSSRPACSASTGLVLAVYPGRSACYRCVFPVEPKQGAVPSCREAGVLGAVAGVIGSLQALEAIKLIADLGEPLLDRLLAIRRPHRCLHDRGHAEAARLSGVLESRGVAASLSSPCATIPK